MSIGQRIRERREELGLSHAELARRLGVTQSTVGNYEAGISSPNGENLLRLFDCLETEPNYLFQDSYRGGKKVLSGPERALLERYRRLSPAGRRTLQSVAEALGSYQEEMEAEQMAPEPKVIPLYRSPAAAGYAAPVFGEDYEPHVLTEDRPQGAEFAVRIQGDSMSPWIPDGSVVYVNHDPLVDGDVGIFCVDGAMVCKQYHKRGGTVYLFSLNRSRADADVVLPESSGRSLVCLGRVMLRGFPLPEE